tara:strand:- start:427 stop:705 length:279 start_codon:yes stop_codon:yes gene_type:complete
MERGEHCNFPDEAKSRKQPKSEHRHIHSVDPSGSESSQYLSVIAHYVVDIGAAETNLGANKRNRNKELAPLSIELESNILVRRSTHFLPDLE